MSTDHGTQFNNRIRAGVERLARIRAALVDAHLDVLVCALPHNVLLLSGYWPVTGQSVVIVRATGESALVVPTDEQGFAQRAWVDRILTFTPSTQPRGSHSLESVSRVLKDATARWHSIASLGFEDGPTFVPSPYAALCVYGPSYLDLITGVWPKAKLHRAGAMLARLRARPTETELGRLRIACRLGANAFRHAARRLRVGLRETAVANGFRDPLTDLSHVDGAERAGGFTFCMSGPNAERACASFQHSTARRIKAGEAILVHCNSFVDGYWTDITRTFCLGQPGARIRAGFEAVLAARDAALATIRAGARASSVDSAARSVLREHGFGSYIAHPLGHGVGFAAIDHDAPPRLRDDSEDVLETGMVMNVEPGIYGPDIGGTRHCDMVRVTDEGYELLTPFLSLRDELVLPEIATRQFSMVEH